MKIKESISISQSPQKIWDFWLLVSTDILWREGFTKAEWTSQAPHGLGLTWVHYHEKLGPYPWTILKWEEGHYFEFIHNKESKLKGSIASYIVEPFIMRIIAPLMRGMMVKGLKKNLINLMEIMEK